MYISICVFFCDCANQLLCQIELCVIVFSVEHARVLYDCSSSAPIQLYPIMKNKLNIWLLCVSVCVRLYIFLFPAIPMCPVWYKEFEAIVDNLGGCGCVCSNFLMSNYFLIIVVTFVCVFWNMILPLNTNYFFQNMLIFLFK